MAALILQTRDNGFLEGWRGYSFEIARVFIGNPSLGPCSQFPLTKFRLSLSGKERVRRHRQV
jgi:hypothetical protein